MNTSVLEEYDAWLRRYRRLYWMRIIPWIWLGAFLFLVALYTGLGVPYGPLGGLFVALVFAPGPIGLLHAGVSLLHYRTERIPVMLEGVRFVEMGIACPVCYLAVAPGAQSCVTCGAALEPPSLD